MPPASRPAVRTDTPAAQDYVITAAVVGKFDSAEGVLCLSGPDPRHHHRLNLQSVTEKTWSAAKGWAHAG